MANMLEKTFNNEELGIKLNSYIDKQQNVWFRGKDVAEILGYSKTRDALSRHVDNEDKKQLFTYNTSVHKTWTVGSNTSVHKTGTVGSNATVPKTWTVGSNTSVHKTWTVGSNVTVPKMSTVGSNATVPKMSTVGKNGSMCTYINGSGFYSLVLSSKLETAKKFKRWITSEVLPSIRKYGQYKLFDSPWNKMIMISNERDLHYKVVQLIRNYYPDSILVAGLGENQDTEDKRLDSYKKGYQRGTPDLMVLNYHNYYKGLCIEFKSPTNNYNISEDQLKMKKKYRDNNYAFILSNDYDKISKLIHKYMDGVRIPCEYCTKAFTTKEKLEIHYKVIHRIEKNA